MAEITQEQVVDYLSNMPVIEIAELVKELEEKWGVSAAPVAVAGAAVAGGCRPAAEEEKTEFDVILADAGARRSRSSRSSRADRLLVSRKPRTSSRARPRPSRRLWQGRGRGHQEEARRSWGQGRGQVGPLVPLALLQGSSGARPRTSGRPVVAHAVRRVRVSRGGSAFRRYPRAAFRVRRNSDGVQGPVELSTSHQPRDGRTDRRHPESDRHPEEQLRQVPPVGHRAA